MSVVDLCLKRIPVELRDDVLDILKQAKPSNSQRKALLLKRGVFKSLADELEVLNDIGASHVAVVLSLIEIFWPR
jgi:eukaryotic translation initiation factor 2-alpha kinase 4